MAKRAKRIAKKTTTRAPKRRKSVKKKADMKRSVATNRKAHWAAYRELQKKVDKAWTKLRADVARKVKPQMLIRDKNHLLLLLGECNYMARECMRLENKNRRR